VAYLQVIVVFSGTGAAATFCIPAIMLAYWRRATVAGMVAAMMGGAGTMILLYILGARGFGSQSIGAASAFRPFYLLGLDPMIWGLLVSAVLGFVVSLLTTPPSADTISRLFDVERSAKEATT
jgi:Na+(H+)/acetate symporter ActP